MNKKLMAVAVAGALGAPAAALAQNYQIYGRANLGVDTYEAKGATAGTAQDYAKRSRVYDSGSRVGFRGTEDLGGGVQALFVIETGVNLDNGTANGQSGGANSSTGAWASRANHVGLAGSIGQITYGRSNVYWVNGAIEQVGANWLNASVPAFTGNFGRGVSVGISRVNNVMQYTSPTWSGVNFVASIAPDRAEALGPNTNPDGQLTGLTVQGTHGPFAWGYDVVVDKSNTPVGGLAKQGVVTGSKLRLGYRYMPAGQISFISTASVVENGGAGGPANTGPAAGSATGLVATCNGTTAASQCDFEQGAVGVSWDHMFGPYHAMVQYATVDKITGSGCSSTVVPASGTAGQQCDNTGAKQITVGMRYIFSKRTHAYVSYNKIDNEANTNMDYIPGGISARLTATNLFVGADPTIIAVGMLHNF